MVDGKHPFPARKAIYLICSVALILGVGLMLYWHWRFVFYPEHAATSFMGTKNHQTVSKRHSDYDWYIEVTVRPGGGAEVLDRHAFHMGYDPKNLQGKLPSPEISACKECWSYFEGKGHGQYGYLLAVLSSDRNNLQLYENFGD